MSNMFFNSKNEGHFNQIEKIIIYRNNVFEITNLVSNERSELFKLKTILCSSNIKTTSIVTYAVLRIYQQVWYHMLS